jgi:hypothetical protein
MRKVRLVSSANAAVFAEQDVLNKYYRTGSWFTRAIRWSLGNVISPGFVYAPAKCNKVHAKQADFSAAAGNVAVHAKRWEIHSSWLPDYLRHL